MHSKVQARIQAILDTYGVDQLDITTGDPAAAAVLGQWQVARGHSFPYLKPAMADADLQLPFQEQSEKGRGKGRRIQGGLPSTQVVVSARQKR